MKYIFLLPILFLSICGISQNPYTYTTKYLTGSDCSKPDTVFLTVVVTGSSGFFSTKVNQNAIVTTFVHQYKPIVTPPPTQNQLPVINAGADIVLTTPTSSTTLKATASDPDGTIVSYKWEKTAGGNMVISTPNGNPTLISQLVEGSYTFKCTVTDNLGASAFDTVNVTVKPGIITQPPPPSTRNNLIFESKFDNVVYTGTKINVNIGQPWGNEQHCCSYSVAAAPIAYSGTGAAKFDLRPGDPPTSGAPRSEISGPGEGATKFERWYGVAFYPVNLSGNDLSVIQWHQNTSVSIPPMSLWVSGNNWSMVHTKEGQGVNNIYSTLAPIEMNKWAIFVFHIKWSNQTDGLLEVWKDGIKVLTYNGITGYVNGNYLKCGIYQWDGVSSQQILYIDEVRIANELGKYSDVSP